MRNRLRSQKDAKLVPSRGGDCVFQHLGFPLLTLTNSVNTKDKSPSVSLCSAESASSRAPILVFQHWVFPVSVRCTENRFPCVLVRQRMVADSGSPPCAKSDNCLTCTVLCTFTLAHHNPVCSFSASPQLVRLRQ